MEIKRVVSMGLVIVFMCSSTFAVPVNITDMPKGWSKAAVEEAIDRKILTDDYGMIRPMEHLTRAEMALGINNVFGATEKADISGYFDVEMGKWYYEEMQKAVKMGTFSGYGDGRLKPNDNISRQEMFSVLYNALEMEEGAISYLAKFKDNNLVGDWAKGRVASMVQNNYIAGNADGRLNPTGNMSREEFAQIMKNIFKGYYNNPGTYTNVPTGNIIVSTRGVTLKDTTVTGDLIIADGVGDGEITLNNVTVIGRTIIRGGGENSIKLLNGTTLKGRVIVNSNIGKVRIYNSKSTINEISVKSEVILDGDFGKVSIDNPTDIEIKGDAKNISVNYKSKVKISKGNVENIEVKNVASGTYIYGSGKVENVNVKANNVSIKTEGTKVIADKNTSGVTAGDKEVKPGSTVTVKETSSGGGSSSGGSSSSGGNKKPSDGSSTEAKLPEFKLVVDEVSHGESGHISLGKDWSKYEVAYSDNSGDFGRNDVWKTLSIKSNDWYSGVSPVFTEGNGIGTLHVNHAFLSGRKYVKPTYFAIRLKENTKLKQIIQVREIAEVNEKENENKIVIGKDFENYRYDITYSRYGNENKDSFEDKEFYSSELVLPYDAELEIYKLGQNGRLNSAGYIINYTHTEKTIAIPDFKVDMIAGGIDLGAEHSAYKYGFVNDTKGEPLTWYSATSNFIDGEKISYAFSEYITIAKAEDLEQRQIIEVKSYHQRANVGFDRSNSTISIKDDDYSLYEYYERGARIDKTNYWHTFDSNELEVDTGDIVYVRKKATKDKFASVSISFEAIPKFKLDVESKTIDLGNKYADYMVAYGVNGDIFTEWYEPSSRLLEEVSCWGPEGWDSHTTDVMIKYNGASVAQTEVMIRPKRPDFKVDVLSGRLIIENFEENKLDYEVMHKGFYFDSWKYYDIERYADILVGQFSYRPTLYIREKGTRNLLPSAAEKIERVRGIVEDVGALEENRFRKIKIRVFDPEETNKFSIEEVTIYSKDLKDTYTYRDGSKGKTLADDFDITRGDAIVLYEYNDSVVTIDNLVLTQKNVPSFSVSEGKVDFGSEYAKYECTGIQEGVLGWYDSKSVNAQSIEVEDFIDEKDKYFVIIAQGDVATEAIKVRIEDDAPSCTADDVNRNVALPEDIQLDKYEYKIDDGSWNECTERTIYVQDNHKHYVYVRLKTGSLGNGVSGYPYMRYFDEANEDTNLALREAIEDVTGLGIMENYEDGTFHETDSITRAEMAAIVGKMTGVSNLIADGKRNEESGFTDVEKGAEYTGWINAISASGMLVGFNESDKFRPNDTVTLNETLTFMINALGRGGYVDKMGTWPANYISDAARLNLLKDVKDTANEVNRGNIAIIVHNTLDTKAWKVVSESEDGEVIQGEETLREIYFSKD